MLHDSPAPKSAGRWTGFEWDYVLIDCPPSLNLLTVNAYDRRSIPCLIPLQSEFFALEGLSQLMLTIREVRQIPQIPALRIEGVAPDHVRCAQ